MSVYVGIGYDSHRLVEGRRFILGGVEVKHEKGLDGHSDADVLTHAVIDALLGAAGMGDIGDHFPDTDTTYSGADSLKLLKSVSSTIFDKGFSLVNIDTTVVAESPKLAMVKETIRSKLSKELGVAKQVVNVKATTGEGMGFVGRKEGVAALAVVSLTRD